ncbi:BamA/TamA family outer membrane protein [Microscilla marina]|uniref:Flammulin 1 n=1 Tax=Microscilla marina ATCC 23134 TaxID=313606 RepID=A1ZS17_MICM2|nr:BamA/TamA family outer membrane protein [Microscilla marina]EAY26740.1 flammulin 1 [Microscilla marina ATCC 23134]
MIDYNKKIYHYLILFVLTPYLLTNNCFAKPKNYKEILHPADTAQYSSRLSPKNTTGNSPFFKKQRKDGFIALPLVYYSPDTRWAAGGMVAYHFKFITPGKKAAHSRLSYIQLTSDYTQNKQLDVWGQWRIFMNDNDYIWSGEARYRNYPDRYYGVGNLTLNDAEETYSYDLLRFQSRVSRQLVKNVYLGLDYEISKYYNMTLQQGKSLESSQVEGTKGGINSGLGLVFMIDTRDNVVSASRGFFLETSCYLFDGVLGSNFSYSNYNFTFNKYFAIGQKMVIATNTVMTFNTGEVPFVNLARAGGNSVLRGYAQYRFRDYNFIASQVEYRYMFLKRLGVVAFAGLGDVFNKSEDLDANALKYSVGGGVRIALDAKEKINLRVDYGVGRDNNGVYVSVTEAF